MLNIHFFNNAYWYKVEVPLIPWIPVQITELGLVELRDAIEIKKNGLEA